MNFPRPSTLCRGTCVLLLSSLFVACGGGYSGGGGGCNGVNGLPCGAPPAPPTGLAASAGNQQVLLKWTASTGATSYNLSRSTTSGGPYTKIASPAATTYTDTTVTNGTTYCYVVAAVNAYGTSGNSSQVSATPSQPITVVNATVDVLANRHAIGPYTYGEAYPKDAATITNSGMNVVRWGGNATSRYNWVTKTYNSAGDYYFSDYGISEIGDSDSAQFIQDVKAAGSNPIMTMVMLDWVSKGDPANGTGNGQLYSFSVAKYGTQCATNPSTGNGDAGNGLKPSPTCSSAVNVTANDPHDANVPLKDDPALGDPAGTVYRHPWATALAAAFGAAPHFYDMDNEIDIWGGKHWDVHPAQSTYNELRDTYLTNARNLKTWDPLAIRLGPVSCCWFFYWRSATGPSETSSHGGVDFLPWWLNEVYWQDQIAGTRSLDVLDIHAYPDGPDTTNFTAAQKQALATRIYRDYWDPTYTSEATYIVNGGFSIEPVDSKPFRIPRMRAIVNSIYPGTPLAMTEWSAAFAGEADFSTALSDADAYGIIGRERAYIAPRWGGPDPANANYQALKLFTNYDGAHHTFGSISVSAKHDADPNLFSVYAATNPGGTSLTLMVVNKDPLNAAQTSFTLSGFTPSQVTSYRLSQSSQTSIVAGASQAWSSTMTFAPYTATLLVVTGSTPSLPAAEWDLNPDTIMVASGGTVTLHPKFVAPVAGTVTLGSATSDPGITVSVSQAQVTAGQTGAITVTAGTGGTPASPGFYHFSGPATDNTGAATTQSGWIVVGKPAATLAKTSGDGQTASVGTTLPQPLTVTLSPGQSGGTAVGASVFFTTSAGSLTNVQVGSEKVFTGSKVIAVTDSSGVASVTLTLPGTAQTVHVTAEGPFGLGHPIVTPSFSETAQ